MVLTALSHRVIYIYIQFDPHVIHTVQLLGATNAAEPPDQSIKVNPHGYNGRFELRLVNDMADADQTKIILKWFTFDSSLVFHQWMPVLHASLDSRSQQLMERVNPWWQSSSSTNFNFQVYWGQFVYSFLLMCHIIGKCGILSKWPSSGKKHARVDSWICAGVIEPSILEASRTWPEVELGWLGINGLLGTS